MVSLSRRFQGIPVSRGIVIGRAYLYDTSLIQVETYSISAEEVEVQEERFREAIRMSAEEIRAMRARVAESLDEAQASLFDAHLQMLSDPMVVEQTLRRIRQERINAEAAFHNVASELTEKLGGIQDEFFQQRSNDLHDVSRRVLKNLCCLDHGHLSDLREEAIVVANDLGPTDTAHMIHSRVLGFCTNLGSRTSHTAIMAQALQIPAVVGLENITKWVKSGDLLVVDGISGLVIINPTPTELDAYRRIEEEWKTQKKRLSALRDLPAVTLDGARIQLLANIELSEETTHVLQQGAEGVGLFRTEFIYLHLDRLPTEDEQFAIYSEVVKAMGDREVVFRTLDLGGDKFLSEVRIEELNPFFGLRALRLCFENPRVFTRQLRALLRATAGKTLHVLFPMVNGVEDFRRAKTILHDVRRELEESTGEGPAQVKVGVMIEIPSAAILSDLLAEEADFFSIGTNDLIQYTMAVDRVNKRVSYLYEPLDPSVLRLIDLTVRNANARGIPVSVCGEMAAEPESAALLVGLGVRKLSMGPVSIPPVKRLLRRVRLADLERLAREILMFPTASQARARLSEAIKELLHSAANEAPTPPAEPASGAEKQSAPAAPVQRVSGEINSTSAG